MVPSLLLSQVGKISNILRRDPLYLKNGTLHKQTVFRFGISEVALFMNGYLNEMLVIFDHGDRSFAVQRRLRSPNFRGKALYIGNGTSEEKIDFIFGISGVDLV